VDHSWGWAKHLGNYSPAQFMIFSPNASPYEVDEIGTATIDKISAKD
jgi:hypothetical protein